MIGEDLGYKPKVVKQAKFEYSPLGQVFNKGLEKEDKKEGLLRKLKNFEGKNEEQLYAIEKQKEQVKKIKDKKATTKKIETEKEEKLYKVNLLKNRLYGGDGIFIMLWILAMRGKKYLKKVPQLKR